MDIHTQTHMIICTVADSKYLLKGLAMVKSLGLPGDMRVMWLCPDLGLNGTYRELLNIAPHYGIMPVPAKALVEADPILEKAINNPASSYGDAYSQWCWTLTPYFINFCLKKYCYQGELVFYVDSDIYFMEHFMLMANSLNDAGKSIMIHSHRSCTREKYDVKTNTAGYYNVGVMAFRKDPVGIGASSWWKEVMLNPGNQYAAAYGTCGDQKYLDLFPALFGTENILAFDEGDTPIAHGAPWNATEYKYLAGASSFPVQHIQTGRHEIIHFWHFSHFNCSFEANTWTSSHNGEWAPEKEHPYVRDLYQQYYEELKRIHLQLKND